MLAPNLLTVVTHPPAPCRGSGATVAYSGGVARCPDCGLIVNVERYHLNDHRPESAVREVGR